MLKINLNRSGSHIDSPDWIKKEVTINPINVDDKFFQYTTTVAVNHKLIRQKSQKILKMKSFINKYNLERINYPSGKNGWKTFE